MDFGRSVPRPVTIAPLQLDDSGATADAEGGASPRTPSPSPRASPTTSGASPSAFGSASEEGGEDEDDLMAHALGRGVRVARPLSVAPDPNVGIEMALAVETSDSSQSLAKEAEERAQEIEEVQSRRRSESMEERDARREADDWALDFAIACADGALFPDPDAEDRALPSALLLWNLHRRGCCCGVPGARGLRPSNGEEDKKLASAFNLATSPIRSGAKSLGPDRYAPQDDCPKNAIQELWGCFGADQRAAGVVQVAGGCVACSRAALHLRRRAGLPA